MSSHRRSPPSTRGRGGTRGSPRTLRPGEAALGCGSGTGGPGRRRGRGFTRADASRWSSTAFPDPQRARCSLRRSTLFGEGPLPRGNRLRRLRGSREGVGLRLLWWHKPRQSIYWETHTHKKIPFLFPFDLLQSSSRTGASRKGDEVGGVGRLRRGGEGARRPVPFDPPEPVTLGVSSPARSQSRRRRQ